MLKIITNKKYFSSKIGCDGYSAIGMVVILLLLGGVLIMELNRYSLSWQKKVIKEREYYVAVNRVLSSIEWAVTQQWPIPTEFWQCQMYQQGHLKACIRQARLSVGHYTLIKGQSGPLTHYHLATYTEGLLNVEKGHWIDYCPDYNRGSDCE